MSQLAGKNLSYNRGVQCGGQEEGGTKGAVFILESGTTISSSNVVVGVDQNEASTGWVPAPFATSGFVKIDSYCVQEFDTLDNSRVNCSTQVKREVQMRNIIARNGKLLAGVKGNYGDIATIDTKTNSYTNLKSMYGNFHSNNKGYEPPMTDANKANVGRKF